MHTLLVLWTILISAPCMARDWTAGLDLSFTKGSYTMPYRLYLPANYSATNKYPIVIFMHGAGERGTDNDKQVNVHIKGLINKTETDYPAILIAPQVPTGKYWYYYPEDLTIDILEHVIQTYSTDVRRIYCTGLSMGGFGTTYYARAYPHLFAAIAPMSGANLPEALPEGHPLRTLPTWLFHGSGDTAVTVDYSRDYYRFTTGVSTILFNQTFYGYTTAITGDIRYTELAGQPHAIWNPIYNHNNTDLYDWMFAKARSMTGEINAGITLSGGSLTIQANSNMPFAQAFLRGSAALNSPLPSWQSFSTKLFDASGKATFTIPKDSEVHRYFYGVTSPQE